MTGTSESAWRCAPLAQEGLGHTPRNRDGVSGVQARHRSVYIIFSPDETTPSTSPFGQTPGEWVSTEIERDQKTLNGFLGG
jgi:hypothetical protein